MSFTIDITLIKNKKHYGVIASRNTGIRIANGDIIAFLDDDGFAHNGWLKNLTKNYKQNNKIVGVGGPVIEIGRDIKTPTKPIKNLAYIRNGKIVTNYRIKKLKEANYLSRKFVQFLQGGNMSFRRDALLTVNGGDTSLIGNFYREETDLCFKIAKIGKLLFEPSAITYHNTAKSGGCREVINFDLNNFLYYMFRNTTYFFFKHFNFRKAFSHTLKSVKRQINLIQKNKTGLTRDYLIILNKKRHIKSVIIGTLVGAYNWFKFRRKDGLICSEPLSVDCFKLMYIPGIIKIIEFESRTQLLKKLFRL
jgi:glycosyltransferase involved in cell wall biosynthesis